LPDEEASGIVDAGLRPDAQHVRISPEGEAPMINRSRRIRSRRTGSLDPRPDSGEGKATKTPDLGHSGQF
jgi:hypothetical protein